MAHVKKDPVIILVEEISELIDCYGKYIAPGHTAPTEFIIPSLSGTIDQFTEEIVFHLGDTIFPASGVVGTVTEEDMHLGFEGNMQVGDVMVLYGYNDVSGMLPFNVEHVRLLTPGVSGLYHIESRIYDTIGNTPIFIKFGLKKDKNG